MCQVEVSDVEGSPSSSGNEDAVAALLRWQREQVGTAGRLTATVQHITRKGKTSPLIWAFRKCRLTALRGCFSIVAVTYRLSVSGPLL